MDIYEELDKMEEELIDLKEQFAKQLSTVDSDVNSFHKTLIELMHQHPEHKSIIEFIIFINDKLETDGKQYRDIMNQTINDMIDVKRKLIKNLKTKHQNELPKKPTLKERFEHIIGALNVTKALIALIGSILVFLAYWFGGDAKEIVEEKTKKLVEDTAKTVIEQSITK